MTVPVAVGMLLYTGAVTVFVAAAIAFGVGFATRGALRPKG